MNNRRSLNFILLVGFTFVFGVVGYEVIEGWGLLDSLFMTVITLTTVGYSEVHRLSDEGRIFTIFLMLGGIATFTYGLRELIASQFFEFEYRRRKKMKKKVSDLKDHAIVCGFGRMGKVICEELKSAGFPFVVIEQKQVCIEQLMESDYLWIEGDAADDSVLIDVNVESAKVLVSAIDSDADSLYVLLAAKNINPDIYAIIRASNESARYRMTKMGANKVVLPLAMSAKKVAQSVLNPAVEEVMDLDSGSGDPDTNLQLVDIFVEPNCQLVGKTIETSDLAKGEHGFVIVGIRRANKEFVFAPDGSVTFEENDCVVGIVKSADYEETQRMFASP